MADTSKRGKSPSRPTLSPRQNSSSGLVRPTKGRAPGFGDALSTLGIRPSLPSTPVTLDGKIGGFSLALDDPLVLGADGKPVSVVQPPGGRVRAGGGNLSTPEGDSATGTDSDMALEIGDTASALENDMTQHPSKTVTLKSDDKTKHTQYKGEPCHCNKLITNIEKILKELEVIKSSLNRIEARYAAVPSAPPQIMAQRQAGPAAGFRQFDFNI